MNEIPTMIAILFCFEPSPGTVAVGESVLLGTGLCDGSTVGDGSGVGVGVKIPLGTGHASLRGRIHGSGGSSN